MGHIFIAYSFADRQYVNQLAEELNSKAYEVWFDQQINYGNLWQAIFEEKLSIAQLVLVVMTPSSYKSFWVKKELIAAHQLGKPVIGILAEGSIWSSNYASKVFTLLLNNQLQDEFFAELNRHIQI